MELAHLMTVRFDIGSPTDVGIGPYGTRLVYPVTGGSFAGERLRGTVVPGGADWVLIDSDNTARLDVRVTLETTDRAFVYFRSRGVLLMDEHFRATIAAGKMSEFGKTHLLMQPRFETGDVRYKWLNQMITIAEGRASAESVEHRVYEAHATA